MFEGGGLVDGVPWVLAAVLAGETVGAAASLRRACGCPARRSPRCSGCARRARLRARPEAAQPAHWDELGSGIGRGLEALSGVTLPYRGADPWPDITLRLGGALLVTLAALLSSWPRADSRGFPFFGARRAAGARRHPDHRDRRRRARSARLRIAALTVCFLWLERLPLRPGIGVAVLGGIALAGALPLSLAPTAATRGSTTARSPRGSARRRRCASTGSRPTARSRGSATGARCCGSRRAKPQYWKLENLEDFDGQRWVMRGVPDPYGPGPEADLEQSWSASPQWTGTATVTVRGLKGDAYAGAGTTLSVDGGDREAIETFSPGTWQADKELKAGDSYRIRFHAPRPERARAVGGQQRLARPAGRRPADHAAAAEARAAGTGRHALAAGHLGQARAAAVRLHRPAARRERAPRHDRARDRGTAQLALLAHLAARPGAQARHAHAVRVRPLASTPT